MESLVISRSLGFTLVLLVMLTACHRATIATPGGGAGLDARLLAQGDSIFNAISCQRCHGANGAGADLGPSLVTGPWLHTTGTVDDIARVIATGITQAQLKGEGRTRAMNPRGGPANLNDEQVRAVATYVYSISRNKR